MLAAGPVDMTGLAVRRVLFCFGRIVGVIMTVIVIAAWAMDVAR